MKILIVLHKAQKKGGMILQHLKMARQFKIECHEVRVFSFDMYFNSTNSFANYFIAYRKLKSLVKKYKPSIILTSDPYFTSFFSLLARKKSTPIILRVGAVYHPFYAGRIIEKLSPGKLFVSFFYFINFIFKQMDKFVMRQMDFVVFNSHFLKKYYQRYTKKSTVIYNGVDIITQKEPCINDPIKLIYVGRIEPRKSIELIIKSLAILKEHNIAFSFTLVGNSSQYPQYWNQLLELIRNNNLKENINIHNEMPNKNIPDILTRHDILLFSSDDRNFPITEGLPNTILEGMANGLSIITTSVAGVPEIITNENGFIVESNPKEFAQKIDFLIKNKKILLKQKKFNIKTISKNYTIKKTSQLYLITFKYCLKN